MNKNHSWSHFLLAATLEIGLLCGSPCAADPLLDESRILYCTLTSRNQQVSVRVLPDDRDEGKFYYIPPQPFIATREIKVANGRTETLPVFHLMKYQKLDANDHWVQGGIVQFALSFALPPEALQSLRNQVRSQAHIPAEVGFEMVPIPIYDAQVHFFAPARSGDAGFKISSANRELLLAPVRIGESVAYSASFTNSETAVFTSLITSATGLPFVCTFEHEAVTPAAGFTIELDWQKIREFVGSGDTKYSTDPELWSAAAWVQNRPIADGDARIADLIDTLIDKDCIKFSIEGVELEKSKAKSLKNRQQAASVLQMIYKEIFGMTLGPVKPQQSKGRLSRRRALELHESLRSVDMETSTLVKVPATVEGILNISDFIADKAKANSLLDGDTENVSADDSLRRFISYSGSDHWEAAYFVLPNLNADDSLGLSEVKMELSITDGTRNLSPFQTAVWRGVDGNGEWTIRGEPARFVSFDLLSLPQAARNSNRTQFRARTTFRAQGVDFSDEQLVSMFSGDSPIAFSLNHFQTVMVNGSKLPFHEETDELVEVILELSSGQAGPDIVRRVLKKDVPNAHFLLHSPDNKVSYQLDATFHFRNRETQKDSYFKWINNGKTRYGRRLTLFPSDVPEIQ